MGVEKNSQYYLYLQGKIREIADFGNTFFKFLNYFGYFLTFCKYAWGFSGWRHENGLCKPKK